MQAAIEVAIAKATAASQRYYDNAVTEGEQQQQSDDSRRRNNSEYHNTRYSQDSVIRNCRGRQRLCTQLRLNAGWLSAWSITANVDDLQADLKQPLKYLRYSFFLFPFPTSPYLSVYKERQHQHQQQQQHPKISFKMYVCMYAVIHSVNRILLQNTIAPGIN
ncbi:unnamed protein product [Brugia pahangi]|uniref:Uncharacterized protein n=1 Tax=Brugia pahangi TaxID=6280 RepID=A0A0N4TKB6_BRUPA|nr:unnamed protein product [Brugia pahangi]